MYEILNSVVYHIEAYLEFCIADRVYGFLLLLFLMILVVLYWRLTGLFIIEKEIKYNDK